MTNSAENIKLIVNSQCGDRPIFPFIEKYESKILQQALHNYMSAIFEDNPLLFIELYPTARLGYSGVGVYRFRAVCQNGPRAWMYAKIGIKVIEDNSIGFDNYAKIAKENKRYITWYSDSGLSGILSPVCYPLYTTFPKDDISDSTITRDFKVGCLLYTEMGNYDGNHNPPKTLHEFLNDKDTWLHNSSKKTSLLVKGIHHIFVEMNKRWKKKEKEVAGPIDWKGIYKWYLRDERFNKLIEGFTKPDSETIDIGNTLIEISQFRNKILEGGFPFKGYLQKPIHGDLHQRNIIIGEDENEFPKIIDFLWSKPSHSVIDFALLEMSLTVLNYLNLIQFHRMQKIIELIEESSEELRQLSGVEQQFAEVVIAIRHNLADCLRHGLKEYYISSFLIGTGMLTVVEPLSRIAAYLKWVKKKICQIEG